MPARTERAGLGRWGGQWPDQYGFVRLHQSYQQYTAGLRKWSISGVQLATAFHVALSPFTALSPPVTAFHRPFTAALVLLQYRLL